MQQFDVVIVGGGAGGLELASRLGRRLGPAGRRRVLLVDSTALHIWKPTLHEVAAGTLDLHQEGLSYLMVARRNHFSFALGEFRGLDAAAHRIVLAPLRDAAGRTIVGEREVDFRWLVIATGSGSNFFGTPGAEHAYVLERATDAERFRRALVDAFMGAASAVPPKRLELAIVGGGATGVELSAELREAHAEMLASIDPASRFELGMTIVEADQRILSGLPQHLSEQAAEALHRIDVRLLTGTKVTAIRLDGLATSAGDVHADLTVWAAGIKAPASNAQLGLTVDARNQFVVDAQLHTSAADVYAMGDCAACPWHDGKLVPARAQAAHQQADYLLDTLLELLAGRPPVSEPFRYRDFGSLVSLGEDKGVGTLMGGLLGKSVFVGGLLAKVMYVSLHLNHHRAVLGSGATAVLALGRLLQRRVAGRMKLH